MVFAIQYMGIPNIIELPLPVRPSLYNTNRVIKRYNTYISRDVQADYGLLGLGTGRFYAASSGLQS